MSCEIEAFATALTIVQVSATKATISDVGKPWRRYLWDSVAVKFDWESEMIGVRSWTEEMFSRDESRARRSSMRRWQGKRNGNTQPMKF